VRFDIHLRELIRVFQSVFGESIWENVGVVFTHWRGDERSIKQRQRSKVTEESFATNYIGEIKKEIDYSFPITNAFFVDSDPFLEKDASGLTITNLTRLYGLARRNKPFLSKEIRAISLAKRMSAAYERSAEKVEAHFNVPERKFKVTIAVCNDTPHEIKRISVTHQTNDTNWGKTNTIVVNNLPSKMFVDHPFSFALDKPSVTSNVLLQFLPVVGQIASAKRGWGKDYWTVVVEIEGKVTLTTDVNDGLFNDIWFTNFWEEDTAESAFLKIKQEITGQKKFWIEIYRTHTGTSTRYLR